MEKSKITIFRIARIAIFSCIMFIQEELLSGIPNIQFTQCLIAIYFFSFGFSDTLIIVIIHTLLDNLFLGSFNIIYTPAMLIGWCSLVFILLLFRKVKNKYIISTIVALHSIFYSLMFAISTCILTKVEIIPYIIADIPFLLLLIINGFITTLILLDPLTGVLTKMNNRFINKTGSEFEK